MNCKNCNTDSLKVLGPSAEYCEACGMVAIGVEGQAAQLLIASCCQPTQPCQKHRIKIATAKMTGGANGYMRNYSAKMCEVTGDVVLTGTFKLDELRRIVQIADEAKWGA